MSGLGNLNAEAAKMFRVRKTCLKMLRKRGYLIEEEGALDMNAEQFRVKFGENPSRSSLTVRAEKSDDSNDKIIVYFPEDEKVGVKPIKAYADQMREESISNAILVVKGGLTPFSKTALKEMARGGYNIEYFRDIELLVDITEHKLVPEHVVLTDQQKKELLERYRLKPNQLPRIQSIDPIARYFGMKKFQVVKIIRPSETAGRYVTYRICL